MISNISRNIQVYKASNATSKRSIENSKNKISRFDNIQDSLTISKEGKILSNIVKAEVDIDDSVAIIADAIIAELQI